MWSEGLFIFSSYWVFLIGDRQCSSPLLTFRVYLTSPDSETHGSDKRNEDNQPNPTQFIDAGNGKDSADRQGVMKHPGKHYYKYSILSRIESGVAYGNRPAKAKNALACRTTAQNMPDDHEGMFSSGPNC
jgi:hypothetical protein